MAARTEKNRWRSVPEFGGWDHNAPGASNYSVVFTQARADRKQRKTDLTEFKRTSLGNERELMAATGKCHRHQKHHHHRHHHHHEQQHQHQHQHRHHHHHRHQPPADDSVVPKKKKILTYINCCIRP
ncbi:lateral signaling target protein 2 homolog isoform X2 [Benincasa hispida]|uniref:lateral signaling target protein 2 homolog isoform X2 n=1 Tax=Benincasa hispida TaxID=102211 RepID=UPI0019006C8B|nr:lateral signaling target protein 2 homolog isoform X2 [Benincasa hispida]